MFIDELCDSFVLHSRGSLRSIRPLLNYLKMNIIVIIRVYDNIKPIQYSN